MKIKVGTWNISGGVSKDISVENYFDQDKSSEIDLTFMNEVIKQINLESLDIIGFQEIITTDRIKYLSRISELTDLKYYKYHELSECNLVENTRCGLAIFSKYPILNSNNMKFTNPNLSITTKSGATYYTYDKGCMICEVLIDSKSINFITNQGFPFIRFNSSADQHANIFKELETFIGNPINVIASGDFNTEDIISYLPKLKNRFTSTFNEITTCDNKKVDDILIDKEFKLIDKKIIKSVSDHFLCIVEVEAGEL